MKDILALILGGQILSETEASFALQQILSSETPVSQTAAFLAVTQSRGMSLSELRGFHSFLRANGQKVNFTDLELIDVCGTGGDGKHSFNISTLTAFVLAGAGVKVAKHGNSSATSGCGSSDVLQFLGAKFTNDEQLLRKQLDSANICYFHAPMFQPALKAVSLLRREIGFRTFFNLLGVLLNPAEPKYQFIGVAEPAVLRLYRYFLENSGGQFALVHSRDGYDEISLTAAFDVVSNDNSETFYPEDLGFQTIGIDELGGGETIEKAAKQFLRILQNEGTTAQKMVVTANTAIAMRLANSQMSFEDCRRQSEKSLDSGAAFEAFNNWKSVE